MGLGDRAQLSLTSYVYGPMIRRMRGSFAPPAEIPIRDLRGQPQPHSSLRKAPLGLNEPTREGLRLGRPPNARSSAPRVAPMLPDGRQSLVSESYYGNCCHPLVLSV